MKGHMGRKSSSMVGKLGQDERDREGGRGLGKTKKEVPDTVVFS